MPTRVFLRGRRFGRARWGLTISGAILVLTAACGDPSAPLYFPDPASIEPVAFTPADGQGGVLGDTALIVEMSDDIDGVRLLDAVITVDEVGGDPVPILPPTYELRLITIEPDGVSLKSGIEHTATVSGLFDTEGRALDDFTWSFTTLQDNTGPARINEVPDDAATNIPRNASVTVQFDEPLDAGQLDQTWLQLNAGAVAGTVFYDAIAQAVVFRPTNALDPLTAYTVNVSDQIVDRFGNPVQGGAFSFAFTTGDADQIDTKAPLFTAAAPTAVYSGATQSVTVTWPQGTDTPDLGPDFVRYDVRVTGPDLSGAGDVLATSFGALTVDVADLPQGTYTFFVEAVDLAGNRREFPCASVPARACPPRATSLAGSLEFEADVRPILEENCGRQNCHVGNDPPGFLDFSPEATYEELLNFVDPQTGTPLVVPGDANVSYLYWKIADEERALRDLGPFQYEGGPMPPTLFPPLTYDQVLTIRTWISQGAVEGTAN